MSHTVRTSPTQEDLRVEKLRRPGSDSLGRLPGSVRQLRHTNTSGLRKCVVRSSGRPVLHAMGSCLVRNYGSLGAPLLL